MTALYSKKKEVPNKYRANLNNEKIGSDGVKTEDQDIPGQRVSNLLLHTILTTIGVYFTSSFIF